MYQNIFWTLDKVAVLCIIVILLCIIIKVIQGNAEFYSNGELSPCMIREAAYNTRQAPTNMFRTDEYLGEAFIDNKKGIDEMVPRAYYAWGGHATKWKR